MLKIEHKTIKQIWLQKYTVGFLDIYLKLFVLT